MTKSNYHRYLKKEMRGEVTLFSGDDYRWLVVYDETTEEPEFSPLFRVIRVKPIDDIMEIRERVRPVQSYLQTVGMAIPMERLLPLADHLGHLGATNIRVVGEMTIPKPWESWDGALLIGELLWQDSVSWLSINTRDVEQEIDISLERKRAVVGQK